MTNTLSPYAAAFIGEQWGHGEDKNTAAQMVAHAILGATLAYVNGGSSGAGASAAVASEAAAQYLTKQFEEKYKGDERYFINGVFQANLLPEEDKAQIRDLTAGIGAVIGGAVGDSTYNAQLAGVIGKNTVENNEYAKYWGCNAKKECGWVEEKPVEQFTFFEENFIRPISVLFGTIGKVNNANNMAKQKNKRPEPVAEANGYPHSIIEKAGKDGQYTTHYGDGSWKQYRGSGKDHGNVPRPNVKESTSNINPNTGIPYINKPVVRPARPDEIPKK